MPGPFKAATAEWREWSDLFRARIEAARDELEMTGLDPVTTENLRGQIAALRGLLELGRPATAGTEATSDNYGLTRPR